MSGRRWLVWGVTLGVLALTGCAGGERTEPGVTEPQPDPPAPLEETAAPPSPRPERMTANGPEANPIGYLQAAEQRFSELDQYMVTFVRKERRGLGFFKSMRGPEEIRCWYRRQPFSIRMQWLDPDIKYGESSYVAGQFDNKVRFVPRHGLFGLPPTLTKVSLQTPVVWGEARYPVSDFGLERVLEKTLDVIEKAGDDAQVAYEGREHPAELAGEMYRISIEVPSSVSPTPRSELLFHIDSGLLAMTRLFNESGRPEAVYLYRDLDTEVALNDEDFLLAEERDKAAAAETRLASEP